MGFNSNKFTFGLTFWEYPVLAILRPHEGELFLFFPFHPHRSNDGVH